MKKNITLFSLNENFYPNIDVEVQVIEDVASNINNMTCGTPFLAIKRAIVSARPANAGETVDTRPRVEVDGNLYTFSETTKTVSNEEEQNGAMIVVNPDGEEYVINSFKKFNTKYEKMANGYIAIDGMKLFARSNGNYAIKTSWGEEQIVLKGSYFCIQDHQDIYGVTNIAFDLTYTTDPKLVEQIEQTMQEIKNSRLTRNII